MTNRHKLTLILSLASLLSLAFYTASVAAADSQANTPGPTSPPIFPVQTSTPNADGSIVHVVQPGQTLYTIAEAYGVTLPELKALNTLASDTIFVGDRIIIRLADTPTPTPAVTDTFTPRPPTATSRPTRTPTRPPPTHTATIIPSLTPTPTPQPLAGLSDPLGKVLMGAIVVLAVAGIGLMIAGTVLRKREGQSQT